MSMCSAWRPCALALTLVFSTGCATHFGARAVPEARYAYNEVLARSWDEQILLNLVRLRYRDTLQFLEVSSVLTQYNFSAGASAGVDWGEGGVFDGGFGAGGDYYERPTITFNPLRGKDFVQQLLAPLGPETLVLLSESGWSVERLLLCCVQRFNGLANAPAAAGPTPDYAPEYRDFRALAIRLRKLQKEGLLDVRRRLGGDKVEVVVRLLAEGEELERVRERLEISEDTNELSVTSDLEVPPGDIQLETRSLLGVLFYLSQAVEVPVEHEEKGWVTVTHDRDGERFDWSEVVGPMFRVRVSKERPTEAFARVHYRDHWFWIDEADLDTKTTFGLLAYLFSLQAGDTGPSPLLTVSAGG